MLHDVELAVQRGRTAQRKPGADLTPVGLELRLREVADRVSSARGRQSILQRVRGMNARLEAAVSQLVRV